MRILIYVATFLVCTSAFAEVKRFKNPEFDGARISHKSNLKGVCRTLGYSHYVKDSVGLNASKVLTRAKGCANTKFGRRCWNDEYKTVYEQAMSTVLLNKKGKAKDFTTDLPIGYLACAK